MSEIIPFGNLPHPYPKVSLFPLLVTWQHLDPSKGSPSRDPTDGMFSSRPPGHFPSNPRQLAVHPSSGTLGIDVAVPYPRARGAERGVPIPIPPQHPHRQVGKAKVTVPGVRAEVPEVAVPVPITRSDNQLPSAAVTSPGSGSSGLG